MTRRDIAEPLADRIIPIAIRQDAAVRIFGIPHDLLIAEAEKIARVVRAMATATPTTPKER